MGHALRNDEITAEGGILECAVIDALHCRRHAESQQIDVSQSIAADGLQSFRQAQIAQIICQSHEIAFRRGIRFVVYAQECA